MLWPRSASGELTPALLCTVLLGGLAVQIALPVATELPARVSSMTRAPGSPTAIDIPDYPAVLGAPLFSPDRRSLAAAVEGGEATTDGQRPELIGVAGDGRAGSAVIKGSDGAAHVVRLGERWRGWRLVGVGARSAAFDGPGGRFTALIGVSSPASAPSQDIRP